MNDLQNQSTRVLNKINTTTYLDLLRENLLTEMNLYEIFQQDNAPAHKLEQTMTWFLENVVELLENWPAQSPDVNIVENAWSGIKRAVYKRFPKNMTQLEEYVLEEFDAYPVEKILWKICTKASLGVYPEFSGKRDSIQTVNVELI